MKPVTLKKLAKHSRLFLSVRTLDDLSRLTGIDEPQWMAFALRQNYHIFSVPKRDGSLRHIEDPAQPLKKAQRALQHFLQAVYHFVRTKAAYGFLVNAADEPAPRHLLSHAQQHVGRRWLLNLDLKDFFHQIKTEDVFRIFTASPFSMTDELADVLTRVATHAGRLPMGAPTSPVLSNFAAISLDQLLLPFCHDHGILYTRYADDLTFSSTEEITLEIVSKIRGIIGQEGYEIKESKYKLRSPGELREVTGLIVGEHGVSLPPTFQGELESDIERLRHLSSTQQIMQRADSAWATEYQDAVRGKLNFMSMVLGKEDAGFRRLKGMFYDAITPDEDFDAISWLHFNYPT